MIDGNASISRFSQYLGLAASAGLLIAMSGCRGRAHEDLYRAKMANEIRVLEDQLYDADYQNRVLRDELRRVHQGEISGPTASSGSGSASDHVIDRHLSVPQPVPQPDEYEVLNPDALNLSDPFVDDPKKDVDATTPTQPRELPKPPAIESSPSAEDGSSDVTPEDKQNVESDAPSRQPLTDPSPGGLGMPSESTPSDTVPTPVPDPTNGPAMELPAPADLPVPADVKPPRELIPPSEGELMDDQIIPGPPTPPDDDPGSPPGKITNPKDAKTMGFDNSPEEPLPIPDHLELHDGISGGHQFDADSEIDGLYLVVQVADEAGTPLSLERFDVDAELTVVVMDPHDTSDDARIGRWDFGPAEVREMVRQAPVDGIHIPIAWQDRFPKSDDVIVHIRLAAAEEEMRCQGRIRLAESVAVSDWLPRG